MSRAQNHVGAVIDCGDGTFMGPFEIMDIAIDQIDARLAKMQARIDELEGALARQENVATAPKSATKRKSRAAKKPARARRKMPPVANSAAIQEYEKQLATHGPAFRQAYALTKQQRAAARRPNRARAQALLSGQFSASAVAHIEIKGPIEEHTVAPVKAALDKHPLAKRINVNINSEGGLISAANEIIELLEGHEAVVHTHAHNECSSAANSVFLAGEHRTASPECSMLLHRPNIPGCDHETPHIKEHLDTLNEANAVRYSEKTGKPRWWWSRLMTIHGNDLDAARAKAYAIVHEIIPAQGMCAA